MLSKTETIKPRFLLDENIQMREAELNSPLFIFAKHLVHPGTPDWLLLEISKKQNLIIVTCDKGLALRALMEKQDVVFQDNSGNRFFFDGTKSQLIQTGCQQNNESELKRIQKIFKYAGIYYRNWYPTIFL